MNKCIKNRQEMSKQLNAFEAILDELTSRKNNVEEQFN